MFWTSQVGFVLTFMGVEGDRSGPRAPVIYFDMEQPGCQPRPGCVIFVTVFAPVIQQKSGLRRPWPRTPTTEFCCRASRICRGMSRRSRTWTSRSGLHHWHTRPVPALRPCMYPWRASWRWTLQHWCIWPIRTREHGPRSSWVRLGRGWVALLVGGLTLLRIKHEPAPTRPSIAVAGSASCRRALGFGSVFSSRPAFPQSQSRCLGGARLKDKED